MTCKTMFPIAAVLLLGLSLGIAVRTSHASDDDKPQPVSLIRVIANPDKFYTHRLRVIGVLGYGGGTDRSVCLYVSETDARNAVLPNCISVEQTFDKADARVGKYVILNATFRYVGGEGPASPR